jgi:hypothetical protein
MVVSVGYNLLRVSQSVCASLAVFQFGNVRRLLLVCNSIRGCVAVRKKKVSYKTRQQRHHAQ